MKIMNYLSIIALGTAVTMVSGGCIKETTDKDKAAPGGKTVITAGILGTKTYMGAADQDGRRKVYWQNGDAINVNGESSSALEGLDEDMGTVRFVFNEPVSGPFKGIYPESAYTEAGIILASEQVAGDGDTFGRDVLPMIACSEDDNLQFRHVCAMLKLPLTAETATAVSKVEFRGNNGEQVSGVFSVDWNTLAVSPAGAVTEADRKVVVKGGWEISAEPVNVYMVIPAGTYEKGFTLKIYGDDDTHGHMTVSNDASYTFAVGQIKVADAVSYESTAFEDGSEERPWEIDSLEEWVEMIAGEKSRDGVYYRLNMDLSISNGGDSPDNHVTTFRGTLDGNGHRVNHSNTTNRNSNNVGLIDINRGTIKNLNITGFIRNGQDSDNTNQVMGAIGHNYGVIDNVTFRGTMLTKSRQSKNIGGICGRNNGGTVKNCRVKLEDHPNYNILSFNVGGICGHNNSTIENCVVESVTLGRVASASGGVCGHNEGTINNCEVLDCTLTGTGVNIGGVCGQNDGIIVNCGVDGGKVTAGTYDAGGIVGLCTGLVVNCYSWITAVNAETKNGVGGICGELNGKETAAALINCYSSCAYGNLTDGQNSDYRGTVVGIVKKYGVRNVYGGPDKVVGAFSVEETGVFSSADNGVALTAEQMTAADGQSITVASTGSAYTNFVDALNAGVEWYNNWSHAGKPAGITLKTWTAEPGSYPVFAASAE